MKKLLRGRSGIILLGMPFLIVFAVISSLAGGNKSASSSDPVSRELVENIYGQAVTELSSVIDARLAESGSVEDAPGIEVDEAISVARSREIAALQKVATNSELINSQAFSCRANRWLDAAEDEWEKTGGSMTGYLYRQLEIRRQDLNDWLLSGQDLKMTAEQRDELIVLNTTEIEAISKAILHLRASWVAAEYESAQAEYEAAKAEHEAALESDRQPPPVPPRPSLELPDIDCNMPVHTLGQQLGSLVLQSQVTREQEAAAVWEPAADLMLGTPNSSNEVSPGGGE